MSRPTDLLSTEGVAAHWHTPINDHAWLTHADVIAAAASTDPAYLERLAVEADSVGARNVAADLRNRKPDEHKCWCGKPAEYVNQTTDASPAHPCCSEHVKDGYLYLTTTATVEEPTDPLIAAADDFQRAADELTAANAPVHVLVDLLEEIHYLRTGDRSPLGDSEGVETRYAATSRVSRRMTVIRWMDRAGMTQPSPAIRRALDAIGGEGF